MLLSYNFLIYYTLTSATFLLKDIFLKQNCDIKYEDTQLINNYKKAYPIVIRNLLASLKVLLSFDVYLTIFGSDYSYLWSLVYIWVGYYVFLLLTNIVFDLNKFNMIESKNNLKIKDSIHVDGPFFILYVDPVKFAKILKPLSLLGWIFMINEYVMLYFIVMTYVIMVLDCCNIAGSEMKAFKQSFDEQRQKIDNKLFFLSNNVTNLKHNKIVSGVYSVGQNIYQKIFKRKQYSEEYVNIIKLDDLSKNNGLPESDITDNIEYILTKHIEKQNDNLTQVQNANLANDEKVSDVPTISITSIATDNSEAEAEPESEAEPEAESEAEPEASNNIVCANGRCRNRKLNIIYLKIF